MNMEDKKKRTANYSNNEKSILAELVMKYKNIVENKRTDASTNSQKVAGWTRLAQEFNSLSTESYRTPNNLKTCWENMKRATKKQVSNRKKEIFMTGGGKPQPPLGNNGGNVIVEAVLGPALEGLSNTYDCDGPDYNEIGTGASVTIDGIENWSPVQTSCGEQQSNETIVISVTEEDKENYCQQDDIIEVKPSTFKKAEESEKTQLNKNKELWESWTPKALKMPLAEPLRSVSGDEWIRRRRPKPDCSSDVLLKEKIELVKILKKNAEEEGNLRILILREQLKQEQIKTEKLTSSN